MAKYTDIINVAKQENQKQGKVNLQRENENEEEFSQSLCEGAHHPASALGSRV